MSSTPLPFEKRLERIREIVTLLDSRDLPLEQGIRLYQEGQILAKACTEELEKARVLVENASSDVFERGASTEEQALVEDIETF